MIFSMCSLRLPFALSNCRKPACNSQRTFCTMSNVDVRGKLSGEFSGRGWMEQPAKERASAGATQRRKCIRYIMTAQVLRQLQHIEEPLAERPGGLTILVVAGATLLQFDGYALARRRIHLDDPGLRTRIAH